MLVKEAKLITGSMTRTSKMPGLSYSLPAWECQTGSKLRKVEGTPCFGCYALKGNYIRYPAIKKAQYKRLASLVHDSWVMAMVAQVKRQKWFRWHDAGDVQSVDHMKKIFEVCRLTPGTSHWLPTQERKYLPLQGITAIAGRAFNLTELGTCLAFPGWQAVAQARHFGCSGHGPCNFFCFFY